MTRHFMLHGTYTGVLLTEPAPIRRRKLYRIYFILAGLAVVGGVLAALSH